MDKVVTPQIDAPVHLVATGSTLALGATVLGMTPDEWIAVASIATVVGVFASAVLVGFRSWALWREDRRRQIETMMNREKHERGE